MKPILLEKDKIEEIEKGNREVESHSRELDDKYGKKFLKLLGKLYKKSKEEHGEDVVLFIINKLKQCRPPDIDESLFVTGLITMLLMTSRVNVLDSTGLHALLGSAISASVKEFIKEIGNDKSFTGKDNGMKN